MTETDLTKTCGSLEEPGQASSSKMATAARRQISSRRCNGRRTMWRPGSTSGCSGMRFTEFGYGGDSEVVAVHRVFNTVYVYDLPVAFDDDYHLDQPYANLLLIALGLLMARASRS